MTPLCDDRIGKKIRHISRRDFWFKAGMGLGGVALVDLLNRDWKGPGAYAPTVGPGEDGASVTGLSGNFAGRTGHGRERRAIDNYTGSLAALSGELQLDLEGH